MAGAISIWRGPLPTGTYQEGRDSFLGLYCAWSHPDRIEIHHVDRGLSPSVADLPNHERMTP